MTGTAHGRQPSVSTSLGKAATAGLDAVAGLIRELQRRFSGAAAGVADREPRSRWRSVTICKPPAEVMPGDKPPAPLADLGDLVEVRVRPALQDKGAELAARLRGPEPGGVSGVLTRVSGDDPRQRIRSALREAKQLIEAGEVLRVDPAPHGQRSASPAGKLVELATRRAGGEGVL
jgi:hypothetical protein